MSFLRNRNRNKKTFEEEDDGRTIVNMNVEGMPWYVKGDEDRRPGSANDTLSEEEMKLYKRAALKSALMIALVFGIVFFIFIAFCDFIWFK